MPTACDPESQVKACAVHLRNGCPIRLAPFVAGCRTAVPQRRVNRGCLFTANVPQIYSRQQGAARYPFGMPLFLFEPDRKVSLRAFGALALAVIFYLAR